MIVTKNGDIMTVGHDEDGEFGAIVLKKPRACQCGKIAAFVYNRDGKSRCTSCDQEYTASKRASGTNQI